MIQTIYSPVEVDGSNDTAMIVCSSGTSTGFSKGSEMKLLIMAITHQLIKKKKK